jgi:hypothetical protein
MATRNGTRKKPDAQAQAPTATALAEPPAPEVSTGPSAEQPAVQQKKRPAASFAAMSDRTTRLEVAVWARVVTVSPTEEYTQYSLTFTRSWRDNDGKWTVNAFYRVHDVPILQSLVARAYEWCIAQRMDVRIESEGEVPF